jgi:hypothetical protein
MGVPLLFNVGLLEAQILLWLSQNYGCVFGGSPSSEVLVYTPPLHCLLSSP